MEIRRNNIGFSATLDLGYKLKRDAEQNRHAIRQVDLAREELTELPGKFVIDHDSDIFETFTLKQKGLFKKKKYLFPKYEKLNEIKNWIVDTVKAETNKKGMLRRFFDLGFKK